MPHLHNIYKGTKLHLSSLSLINLLLGFFASYLPEQIWYKSSFPSMRLLFASLWYADCTVRGGVDTCLSLTLSGYRNRCLSCSTSMSLAVIYSNTPIVQVRAGRGGKVRSLCHNFLGRHDIASGDIAQSPNTKVSARYDFGIWWEKTLALSNLPPWLNSPPKFTESYKHLHLVDRVCSRNCKDKTFERIY